MQCYACALHVAALHKIFRGAAPGRPCRRDITTCPQSSIKVGILDVLMQFW